MVRLLTPNDYRSMPWKNGAGRTTEIAVYPPGVALDAFLWRVSIADVERDGPFSRFPGIDRTIVLLEGSGMRLRSGRSDTRVTTRFAPKDLSGDDAIECKLVAGPCRDFNAMFRRNHARGSVAVVREGGMEFAAVVPSSGFRCRRAARMQPAWPCARTGWRRVTRCSSTPPAATLAMARSSLTPLAAGAVALVVSIDCP